MFAADIYFRGNDKGVNCSSEQFEMQLIDQLGDSRPIVFFVHGRGKHPEKGLGYLPEFEDRYGIKVLMFDWPSWINQISRPEKKAVIAGRHLSNCISSFSNFKNKNRKIFEGRKVFLMVHSMGNVVLKSFAENYLKSRKFEKIFYSTILNAPDVPAFKHSTWVDKLFSISKNIYITNNVEDLVLIGSKIVDYKDRKIFRGNRLGASKRNFLIFGKSISKNAKYLDFSLITYGEHEYFLESSSSLVPKVYDSIFEGHEKFKLGHKIEGLNENIYSFNFNFYN